MECTIIQPCTYTLIYQHVNIYTAQTNTFSHFKYYYFFLKLFFFHYKIPLKCSSTNVLVFEFKFFSYYQTDNPLLSSTVKYITRINIMLQVKTSPWIPPPVPLPTPRHRVALSGPPCLRPSLRLPTHTYTNRQTEECGNAGGGFESHRLKSRCWPAWWREERKRKEEKNKVWFQPELLCEDNDTFFALSIFIKHIFKVKRVTVGDFLKRENSDIKWSYFALQCSLIEVPFILVVNSNTMSGGNFKHWYFLR